MKRRKSKLEASKGNTSTREEVKQLYKTALESEDLQSIKSKILALPQQVNQNTSALAIVLAAKVAFMKGLDILLQMDPAKSDFLRLIFDKSTSSNSTLEDIWNMALDASWKGACGLGHSPAHTRCLSLITS
jgi:hypothetical protein